MGGEVSKHIDKALKDQPLYQRAVDASFSEYSKPQELPDGTTIPGVEQAYLLDACKSALKVRFGDLQIVQRSMICPSV